MKYVIVYWSRYGNGKKVVESLTSKLEAKGEVNVYKTDEVDPQAMPDADFYVFSAAQEVLNIQRDMRKFLKKLQVLNEKKYGLINTHGMEKRNQLGKMEKLLSEKKMIKVATVEFLIGDGGEQGNGLPSGWEAKLDDFAGKI